MGVTAKSRHSGLTGEGDQSRLVYKERGPQSRYRDTTGGSVLMLQLEQVCLRNVLLQLISRELLQTFFSFALRMTNKVFG